MVISMAIVHRNLNRRLRAKLTPAVITPCNKRCEAAVMSACQTPADDQVILLSPAAASFDQFTSFEARGEAFCQIAEQQIAHLKAAQTEERTAGHV